MSRGLENIAVIHKDIILQENVRALYIITK
jgi:hypothetical protein